jgi:hypothetical protein
VVAPIQNYPADRLGFSWYRTQQAERAHVPLGGAPVLDGVMSEDEWSDAVRWEFIGGEGVYAKRDSDFLYLGLRSQRGGFASIAVSKDDTIRILHSSTATITAVYELGASGSWHLTQAFESVNGTWDPGSRRPRQGAEAERLKQEHLSTYSWLASTVSLGTPNEMEYQISLDLIEPGASFISIVLYQHAGDVRFAHSPSGLSDGSLNRDLVQGGSPETLGFSPETWILLAW